MTYKLAIFDFDGTLADSFPFFISVFNTIADQHGFRRIDPERVDGMRHHTTREMMRQIGMPAWKLPLASRSFMAMMQDSADSIHLFDGIDAAVRALAGSGMRLAIVSSNSEHNVRRILGQGLVPLISRFECGMSIFGKASKIRQVIRQSGVAPADAIYIGDQRTDAQAARNAGAAFGAVHWGYATIEALRQHDPDLEFTTPHGLVGLMGGTKSA
jgi:phosphoglycolate phosphatase